MLVLYSTKSITYKVVIIFGSVLNTKLKLVLFSGLHCKYMYFHHMHIHMVERKALRKHAELREMYAKMRVHHKRILTKFRRFMPKSCLFRASQLTWKASERLFLTLRWYVLKAHEANMYYSCTLATVSGTTHFALVQSHRRNICYSETVLWYIQCIQLV